VMNRYVRGVLRALDALGVEAFYPGRDAITVDGRILGLVSFEVDAAGTLLFEAIVANREDFGRLPALLEAVDPTGVVPAIFLHADGVTSLARLDRAVTTGEVAEAVRRGYADAFGVESEMDGRPLAAAAEDAAAWVASRRVRPGFDRRAASRIQLGMLEVRLAAAGGRIADVLVSGDFIADSSAIAELEAGLRGAAATPAGVAAAVDAVFARAAHFVLGIGPLPTLLDTIVQALPA
jgi:hypothetical protein